MAKTGNIPWNKGKVLKLEYTFNKKSKKRYRMGGGAKKGRSYTIYQLHNVETKESHVCAGNYELQKICLDKKISFSALFTNIKSGKPTKNHWTLQIEKL